MNCSFRFLSGLVCWLVTFTAADNRSKIGSMTSIRNKINLQSQACFIINSDPSVLKRLYDVYNNKREGFKDTRMSTESDMFAGFLSVPGSLIGPSFVVGVIGTPIASGLFLGACVPVALSALQLISYGLKRHRGSWSEIIAWDLINNSLTESGVIKSNDSFETRARAVCSLQADTTLSQDQMDGLSKILRNYIRAYKVKPEVKPEVEPELLEDKVEPEEDIDSHFWRLHDQVVNDLVRQDPSWSKFLSTNLDTVKLQ